jgi:integrative and conjugative element protein (TIGR02256 family)
MEYLSAGDPQQMPSSNTLTRLWIPEPCLRSLRDEASRHAPDAESGGLVLGYWATTTEGVVTHVTTPGPKAVRGQSRFVPDADHDEIEVERLWRQTDGATTYLGDWHSHPSSGGGLSWKDQRTLDRIARDPSAFAPTPLMLVVAKPDRSWVLAAWRGSRIGVGWIRWLHCERVTVAEF